MSIFSRFFDARALEHSVPSSLKIAALGGTTGVFTALDDPNLRVFLEDGQPTAGNGEIITELKALRYSGYFRAVSLISSTIGILPNHLYRKIQVDTTDDDGTVTTSTGAEKATDHPVFSLLYTKPNPFQTPFEFWSYMTGRALTLGIAFAKKTYRIDFSVKGGRVIQWLIPLDPRRVAVSMKNDYTLLFKYSGNAGVEYIPQDDMFWFRSPVSVDGVTGTRLIDVASQTIALARQSERANAKVLQNGALVGGVLAHPKALSDEAIERLRTQFEERQSSPENSGKWIVAEDGLEVVPFGQTLQEAQNHEQRSFQIEEMGRFTGIPRPLLFLGETTWGTGIEQLGLFFITYCLLPWFVSIEQAISRSLLSESEQGQYFAKINDGALLRGSLDSQASFFSKALGAGGGYGWMVPNEVRDKFNLNPRDDGNDLPQPAAVLSAEAAAEAAASAGTDPGAVDPNSQPNPGDGGKGSKGTGGKGK